MISLKGMCKQYKIDLAGFIHTNTQIIKKVMNLNRSRRNTRRDREEE